MNFTPTKDFYDEDLRSSYQVGLNYTIRARPANPENLDDKGTPIEETQLFKKVQQWLAEGKVRMGTADPVFIAGEAKVAGKGEVS